MSKKPKPAPTRPGKPGAQPTKPPTFKEPNISRRPPRVPGR